MNFASHARRRAEQAELHTKPTEFCRDMKNSKKILDKSEGTAYLVINRIKSNSTGVKINARFMDEQTRRIGMMLSFREETLSFSGEKRNFFLKIKGMLMNLMWTGNKFAG
jgi:hypothetical protein